MRLRQQDKLGRRARWQGKARKAERRGKVHWSAFEAGRDEISVDRLGVVPDDEVAEIAMREFNDKFYGWYVLTVLDVSMAGCTAQCSEKDGNPYHADIVCPKCDADDRKHFLREIAVRLAARAEFKPWSRKG